jgi:hypothetical protein
MHWLIVASLLAANPDPSGARQREAGGREEKGQPASQETSSEKQAADEKRKLEEEIAREIGGQPASPAAPGATAAQGGSAAAQTPPDRGGQGQTGGNPFGRLMLLPDVSAIGSGALAWNRLDVATLSPRSEPFAPASEVRPVFQELELALQAVVDPYARADVFLAFGDEGAELEEAYLTTLRLPAGLQVRGGKLYAPFGRLNQQHPHTFEFVDRPLALARLLGPDGFGGPGVDVAWLAPTPWFAELHVAYQALTPGFQEASRNGGVARLVQFFDVGEASTLGVGFSGGLLDEPGAGARDLLGGDVYLKVRPPRARSYVALQGEVVARRLRGVVAPEGEEAPAEAAGTEWGGYAQALYRHGTYFAYGARYERAPAVAGGPEHRVSALVSWLPSEFQRIRLQVSYDRLPGGQDGLEALLNLQFGIGAHGAHPF